MFRLSAARAFFASRAALEASPGTSPGARKTFFNASADDDDGDGFDSAVSAAGAGRPADVTATLSDQQRRDREREERRRLRILSKDFGVAATKIFDRLTTTLDALEDVDRRTAISTSALTQRLAFDEMTHNSLSSLLQEIVASTAVAYDPLDAAARPQRGGGAAAPIASRSDDDRLDTLALKRSLSAAERESFFRYTRRQSRIREGERTALAHAKARNLTHLLQREKEQEKRQRQRKQAEAAAARARRAERGSEWEDDAESGVSL